MLLKIIPFLFETKKNRIFSFCVMGILIFFISKEYGFFHDDILFGSKMGNHLYNNSIFDWTIPDEFDPGHPPFFGFILALSWKILGHKLWVSHLVMLPFIIGFFYQLFQFICYFIKDIKHQFFAFLLIIIDPTISSSFVLVNMEIISMFLFFLIINSIKERKNVIKCIGLLFLSILSIRYMMLFAGIFLFEISLKLFVQKNKLKSVLNMQFLLPYFIGCLPGAVFVLWRVLTKGSLTNPNSPWEDYGHLADLNYLIRNCIVLIWRYIDFGRIFIMLFILISIFKFRKKIIISKSLQQLLLVAIAPIFFILITILMITNTVGLRYFIVSYICLNLFAFIILNKFYKSKKILYSILFVGLLTGNLWVYPKTLSQAWHNTLGHLPYHSLLLEAINYLNKNNINIEEVASFFPNYNVLDYIDFKGDKRSFTKFNAKNYYVFYASVYNLTDEEQKTLVNDYSVLKQFHKFNTTIKIYILNNHDITRRKSDIKPN